MGFWRRSSGDVALLTDSMRTLSGPNAFARVSVRTTAGTPLREFAVRDASTEHGSGCGPTLKPHRTYLEMCSANAYALGTVMGIEEGWGLPLGGYRSLKCPRCLRRRRQHHASLARLLRHQRSRRDLRHQDARRHHLPVPATARTTTLLRPAAQEPGATRAAAAGPATRPAVTARLGRAAEPQRPVVAVRRQRVEQR